MSLLGAKDVAVSLGGRRVLGGAHFALGAGEVVGLIGPNGAGKTTLLRVLAGLLRPETGDVRIDGRPAQSLSRAERARQVAYLPQGGTSHWAVTVETLVSMGRLPYLGSWRGLAAADRAAVDHALRVCDMARFAARPVTTLSGGERARALLARALAGEPRVLLADEPVSGLDLAHQLDVMETLRGLACDGAGVVTVMHDLSLAARFCDRLVLLSDGTVAAEGACASVLSADNLARCYGVRSVSGEIAGIPYLLAVERIHADT